MQRLIHFYSPKVREDFKEIFLILELQEAHVTRLHCWNTIHTYFNAVMIVTSINFCMQGNLHINLLSIATAKLNKIDSLILRFTCENVVWKDTAYSETN